MYEEAHGLSDQVATPGKTRADGRSLRRRASAAVRCGGSVGAGSGAEELGQPGGWHADHRRQLRRQELTIDVGRNPLDQRTGELHQPGPAIDARHVAARCELADQVIRQRNGCADTRFEGLRAFLADQRVRIVTVGQEEKAELAALLHLADRVLERAPGRGAPGTVAVEAEYDLTHQPEDPLQVLGGRGGTERCHGVGDPRLVQTHDIHVALDHQQPREIARRLACLVQTVELAALVEELGLGRVQVLGLTLVEDAAAETDGPAADVADREHHSVAESIVLTRSAVGALDHEPRACERLPLFLGRPVAVEQRAPARRRVSDAEARQAVAGQPATREILARARFAAERLPEEERRPLERDVQVLVRPRRGIAAFARDLETGARRELLHGLDEAEMVELHDEAERRTVRAATKAVIELLVRAHRERRRLLVVKRAAGLVLAARALELHAAADHLDDVGACDQLVDEMLRDAAGHGNPRRRSPFSIGSATRLRSSRSRRASP